ncbi:MAG: lytic murein transglycosylase, partial [Pseudolabrys sp.]
MRTIARAVAIAFFTVAATVCGEAADAAFQQWLAAQWPAAQAMGVSRATFDTAIRGLEPDLSLPDLAIPGQAEKAPQQPEFVQTPSQYLRESSFDRLATRGRQLATQYR